MRNWRVFPKPVTYYDTVTSAVFNIEAKDSVLHWPSVLVLVSSMVHGTMGCVVIRSNSTSLLASIINFVPKFFWLIAPVVFGHVSPCYKRMLELPALSQSL